MIKKIHKIKTGNLTLKIKEGDPNEFFNVEARNNPKRGFLFVSKVLGKHIAVNIEKMEEIHTLLSNKAISSINRDKKTLVIGMAETATLLGFGVYKKIARYFNNPRLINYIQSTRYPSDGAIPFEESHSHAPSQFIHLNNPDSYEQVVLVDDELSTGNTFVGFEKILFERMKNLKKITWICLTDFRKKEVKKTQKKKKDVACLLSGEWEFEWKNKPESLPSACENINSVDPKKICSLGRYTEFDWFNNNRVDPYIKQQIEEIAPKGKVLVLGTGEFMPLPYLVLKHIQSEYQLEDLYFQATTRSPAMMPKLEWEVDHYREGVRQYLYNYHPENYDTIILCVETETNAIVEKMAQDLNAKIIFCKS